MLCLPVNFIFRIFANLTKITSFVPILKKINEIISATAFFLFVTVFPAMAQGISIPVRRDASCAPIRRDVKMLCDPELAGRKSGTSQMFQLSTMLSQRFEQLGLEQVGEGWFQNFRLGAGGIGRNVIGKIEGTSGKYLVLMAYYDGLGVNDGVLYPGADSNASGVAALLEIARILTSGEVQRKDGVLFVLLDGHYDSYSGAEHFLGQFSRAQIAAVVNLDTIGGSKTPLDVRRPRYLMALGGKRYAKDLESCARIGKIEMYYDYYRSEMFTQMFYGKTGDQSVFVKAGIPTVLLTSGITHDTNKPSDRPEALDYNAMRYRCLSVARWINLKTRK